MEKILRSAPDALVSVPGGVRKRSSVTVTAPVVTAPASQAKPMTSDIPMKCISTVSPTELMELQ